MPKKRPKPTRVQRIMLEYACDHCRAWPRDWCVTASGKRAYGLHSARFNSATRAGVFPLKD